MSDFAETICALSTPMGHSALGLIRISGPKSSKILKDLAGILPEPRVSRLCILKNHRSEVIDEVVATFYPGPHSYTGEDMVEISAHGNPLILDEIIAEIVSRETRGAEAGEFTRRALANGKLSIDQVESLDWVLNSSTREGVKLGLRSKVEGLSGSVEEIRGLFLDLKVQIEAQLDFSEAEVGELDKVQIIKTADELRFKIEAWAKAFDIHKYLLNSWTVALIGPPNSGKSSLFNALVGSDRAIVFDQPGTTRDFLHQSIKIDGLPVTLIDTAGIRNNADPIEAIGIQKTYEAMKGADLICWVTDSSEGAPPELLSKHSSKKWLLIRSKSDLGGRAPEKFISISVKTGDGVNEFRKLMLPTQKEADALTEDWLPLTSGRQRDLVLSAADCLLSMSEDLRAGKYLDLSSQWVDKAQRQLSQIIDSVPNEDVIGAIFSRFCIGK